MLLIGNTGLTGYELDARHRAKESKPIVGNRLASAMITCQGQDGRAKGGQDRLVMGWLGFTVALRAGLKAGTGSQRGH